MMAGDLPPEKLVLSSLQADAVGVGVAVDVPIPDDTHLVLNLFDVSDLTDPNVEVQMLVEMQENGKAMKPVHLHRYQGGVFPTIDYKQEASPEEIVSEDGGRTWRQLTGADDVESMRKDQALTFAFRQIMSGYEFSTGGSYKKPMIRKTFKLIGAESAQITTKTEWL